MIFSNIIGTHNVNIIPLDVTSKSVTFVASAHTVKEWYITVKKSKGSIKVIHHNGDCDFEMKNPMSMKTKMFESLDLFSESVAKKLVKIQKLRAKQCLNR